MKKTESEVKNTLSQYHMFGKYSIKSLKTMIDTLNSLHDRQTKLQKLVTTKLFTEVKHAGDALDYSVEWQLFLELTKEEHVTKYKEVYKAGIELLDAIAVLGRQNSFSPKLSSFIRPNGENTVGKRILDANGDQNAQNCVNSGEEQLIAFEEAIIEHVGM